MGIELKHFVRAEFVRNGVDWFDKMAADLLQKLDGFRTAWGHSVIISPAPGAVGRHLGKHALSQHNFDAWGEVRAVDIMLPEMKQAVDRQRAFSVAKAAGFTGIGVSPIWKPYPGLHLDVRRNRPPGQPSVWGYVHDKRGNQIMVGLAEVNVDPRAK